jgi:F-type H+-transporting ATPase subunit delta
MPTIDYKIQSIGAVYALALYREAQKQNALAEVTDDVRGIGELLRSNETFRRFTEALTIGEEERLTSLDNIFSGRVHTLTLNALKALARRDRLMFLAAFVSAFSTLLRKMGGIIDAYLVSAFELPPAALQRVSDALARIFAKTVELQVKMDPALVGGVTLTVGDTLFDASVATRLKKLQEQLQHTNRLKVETAVGNY